MNPNVNSRAINIDEMRMSGRNVEAVIFGFAMTAMLVATLILNAIS